MDFLKVHGAGNDFIFIDGRAAEVPGPETVRQLCSRGFGVGADGVLVFVGQVEAPRMLIFNADGSRAEMCGNGIRCFVMALARHHGLEANPVTVDTDAGPKSCAWSAAENGVFWVSVEMGRAEVAAADVPLRELGLEQLPSYAVALRGQPVSTGNPHYVIFSTLSREQKREMGPIIGRSRFFPAGVNVEFAELLADGAIRLDVHERGCGFTLACGTGACATVAAAVHRNLVPAGAEQRVILPGGTLFIKVEKTGSVIMRGPAVEVFQGRVSI